jgi:hypothetical protein
LSDRTCDLIRYANPSTEKYVKQPTTRKTTVAAVPANAAPPEPTARHLSRYNTHVEFSLKETTSNAPAILQKLIAELVIQNPSILFYTGKHEKIDTEDFPNDKPLFDAMFNTKATKDRNQKLIIDIEIHSEKQFQDIKVCVEPT